MNKFTITNLQAIEKWDLCLTSPLPYRPNPRVAEICTQVTLKYPEEWIDSETVKKIILCWLDLNEKRQELVCAEMDTYLYEMDSESVDEWSKARQAFQVAENAWKFYLDGGYSILYKFRE